MVAMIEQHRELLNELCFRYRVRTLELVGSAAEGRFDSDRSDLDFLVDFLPLAADRYAKAYFGLLHGLEDLFQRKIDLIMTRAIRNPYFLESVNRQRTVLYAA